MEWMFLLQTSPPAQCDSGKPNSQNLKYGKAVVTWRQQDHELLFLSFVYRCGPINSISHFKLHFLYQLGTTWRCCYWLKCLYVFKRDIMHDDVSRAQHIQFRDTDAFNSSVCTLETSQQRRKRSMSIAIHDDNRQCLQITFLLYFVVVFAILYFPDNLHHKLWLNRYDTYSYAISIVINRWSNSLDLSFVNQTSNTKLTDEPV